MPFLDWRAPQSTDVSTETSSHPVFQTQLTLIVSSARRDELLGYIRGVFEGPLGGELRLELPMGWTVYWKLREGDSRLLLAHPDHESWVGSVSLNSHHAARTLQLMKALTPSSNIALGDLRHEGSWSGVSNLELVLSLR